MNLLLDYGKEWDYINTCGYRIRLEVLQTATNRGWCVHSSLEKEWYIPQPHYIRKEQDDRDCNSIKEKPHLRRAGG